MNERSRDLQLSERAVTGSGIDTQAYAAVGSDARRRQGIPLPGEYPFTGGIKDRLYGDVPWVMGMYSGFSSARETNRRIRKLLETGQRGFSVALDLPTQNGLDSDHPLARGEVGRVGVPLDTLDDMEQLLDGINFDDVEQVRTTANAIGPIAVAMFAVATEKRGVEPQTFRLLLQNDVLKEYIARGTYVFPPAQGLRFAVDVVEYCAAHMPEWEPIEFCGYHIRDSGSTAVQEVGIAIGNALAYLDEADRRGVSIDDIAPQLYMFLSSGLDLFEEVAKFRAARQVWAALLHERYGVRKERCALRIFSYTLGGSLTAVEPMNNSVRVAYEALSAVLGGVQTLATSSYDEALGLPSDEAVHLSLRTQQILAHETGVRRITDPLAGSYYVEWMTNELASLISDYVATINEQGGAIAALQSGWLSDEIGRSAYEQARAVESGTQPVVGVNRNALAQQSGPRIRAAPMREEAEADQLARLRTVRESRNPEEVRASLDALQRAAAGSENTVPAVMGAVRAYASVGEICGALQEVWGTVRSDVWQIS